MSSSFRNWEVGDDSPLILYDARHFFIQYSFFSLFINIPILLFSQMLQLLHRSLPFKIVSFLKSPNP
jgi:hypothetical protein